MDALFRKVSRAETNNKQMTRTMSQTSIHRLLYSRLVLSIVLRCHKSITKSY